MPDNLNSNALNQYAARFATTVLNDVYRSQDIISGAGLLQLTPVKQVNLGILNHLFEDWKSTAEKFRSPYFDFTNEEVKKALEDFMNTTSQYIAIKRGDLEPLLLTSVKDALKLLLSPESYFEEKIRETEENEFTLAKAEQLVKYTRIHRGIAEALLSKFSENGSHSIYLTQAISWLYDIKNDKNLIDDTEQYVAQFSDVFPINLKELVQTDTVKSEPVVAKNESKSFFDSALNELDTVKPKAAAPVRAESGTAVLSEIVSKTATPESQSLNNRFKVNIPKSTEENTYANVPVKVESIAGSIPLGQRFMFVNQLFNKSSDHFEKAIYELDAVKSFEEAQNLIWHRYASKYAWDVNGEAVTALLAIVKRKFA